MSDFIKPAYSRNVYPDEIVTSSGAALSTELDALDGVTASATELNKLDGCTATVAQLNYVAGVTAGTSAASKAVVLGADSKIDTIDVTSLKTGGVAITSTAAEMNTLDGNVASFTFTPAAGAANVCEVTIQAKDAAGVNMAVPVEFMVWLSDAATGISPSAVTTSGTVTAKAASGAVMGTLTAKQSLMCQTKADGSFILEITDTAKTGFYICAKSGQARSISAALIAGNYGA